MTTSKFRQLLTFGRGLIASCLMAALLVSELSAATRVAGEDPIPVAAWILLLSPDQEAVLARRWAAYVGSHEGAVTAESGLRSELDHAGRLREHAAFSAFEEGVSEILTEWQRELWPATSSLLDVRETSSSGRSFAGQFGGVVGTPEEAMALLPLRDFGVDVVRAAIRTLSPTSAARRREALDVLDQLSDLSLAFHRKYRAGEDAKSWLEEHSVILRARWRSAIDRNDEYVQRIIRSMPLEPFASALWAGHVAVRTGLLAPGISPLVQASLAPRDEEGRKILREIREELEQFYDEYNDFRMGVVDVVHPLFAPPERRVQTRLFLERFYEITNSPRVERERVRGRRFSFATNGIRVVGRTASVELAAPALHMDAKAAEKAIELLDLDTRSRASLIAVSSELAGALSRAEVEGWAAIDFLRIAIGIRPNILSGQMMIVQALHLRGERLAAVISPKWSYTHAIERLRNATEAEEEFYRAQLDARERADFDRQVLRLANPTIEAQIASHQNLLPTASDSAALDAQEALDRWRSSSRLTFGWWINIGYDGVVPVMLPDDERAMRDAENMVRQAMVRVRYDL